MLRCPQRTWMLTFAGLLWLAPGGARAGGPTAFLYATIDSLQQPSLFSFQDISTTATRLEFYDPADLLTQKEDDGVAPDVSLASLNGGQGFPFFGMFFDAVTMSTNGLLHFQFDASSDAHTNECPLGVADPNALIAVLWDDLFLSRFDPESGGFVEPFSTCIYSAGGAGDCVVFQWSHADHAGGGTDSFDFQAVLYDSGNILMLYPESTPGVSFNPEHGSGSTTGIQSADGSESVTLSCNRNNSLPANFALLFAHPSPEPAENLMALVAFASVALARLAKRGAGLTNV